MSHERPCLDSAAEIEQQACWPDPRRVTVGKVFVNKWWDFFSLKTLSMMFFEAKSLLSHLFRQNGTQKQTLTNQHNKSVFLVTLSPIGCHFLICGYISCIILITLLAFIHGFICFLIFSTETETSSKTSCKYKKKKKPYF